MSFAARQSAMRGVEIWRSGGVKFPVEEIVTPPVSCLIYEAYSEWYLGEIAACQANTAEAISLAKELKDMIALATTLYLGGICAASRIFALPTKNRLCGAGFLSSTRGMHRVVLKRPEVGVAHNGSDHQARKLNP